MIVIDASVAVKWIVREVHHETALDIFDREWERIAPDLILPEVANVLRKKLKNREISQDQLTIGLHGLTVAIPRLVPSSELVNDAAALSLELDHSVYDCFYLACALGRGVLLSADERFVRKCVDRGYGEFVAVLDENCLEIVGARIALSSVSLSSIETIERLSQKLQGAMHSLIEAVVFSAATPRAGTIAEATLSPVLESPAYLRLASELEALDLEQLSVILALGWLGRSGCSATQWTSLHESARRVTARGFRAHPAYFMFQVSNVAAGLTKLKIYLQDPPPGDGA